MTREVKRKKNKCTCLTCFVGVNIYVLLIVYLAGILYGEIIIKYTQLDIDIISIFLYFHSRFYPLQCSLSRY